MQVFFYADLWTDPCGPIRASHVLMWVSCDGLVNSNSRPDPHILCKPVDRLGPNCHPYLFEDLQIKDVYNHENKRPN